jgi:radical SAM protein with 4Fe4S-binding SPASM domain
MLNRYVVTTRCGVTPVLFNTISSKTLPVDASTEQLSSELFLEGQERELLERRLFGRPKAASFVVATTWECSLRCGHCCVIDKLRKVDDRELDVEKLKTFWNRYRDAYAADKAYPMMMAIVGGEAVGLRPEKSLAVLRAFWEVFPEHEHAVTTTTTNLFYKLTKDHLSLFDELGLVTVSIDGARDDHNKQRKAFTLRDENPFDLAMANLKTLLNRDENFYRKVRIQASVRDEVFFDNAKRVAFFEAVMRAGVPYEQIKWGGLYPTKREPEYSRAFQAVKLRGNVRTSPCCKYRMMSRFQIDPDNKVYTDYYQRDYIEDISLLGELDDPLEAMADRYRSLIKREMPIFGDENCMKCPVLGYCWGGCVNGTVIIGNKPSYGCGQAALVEKIGGMAASGTLVSPLPIISSDVFG